MLTENEVVECAASWLEHQGFIIMQKRTNTAKGDDIIARKLPDGKALNIECKGAQSLHGNQLDTWKNAAYALFGAVIEVEYKRPSELHAIAIPDIDSYRNMLNGLKEFFSRQQISLLWISENGAVDVWYAPNLSVEFES